MALVVALVTLGPVVAVLAPNIPLKVQPVIVPHWFETTATHLPADQVLATYPFASADSQAPMPWQAIPGLHFKMAGGGGPAGTVARAGADKTGFRLLATASIPLGPSPAPTKANLDAIRRALHSWGVTMVVVPDDAGLPDFDRGRGSAYGVAFFSAVLGSAPVRQDGAWVWFVSEDVQPPIPLSGSVFAGCVGAGVDHGQPPALAARCVAAASERGTRIGS